MEDENMTCTTTLETFEDISSPPVGDRHRQCDVCRAAVFKYRCPRCHVTSCSLSCVKQHKLSSECNGQRDKTAYVPMDDFTDLHLLNDYRYLEDLERRTSQVTSARENWQHGCQRRQQLIWEARRRRIFLRLAPYPLSQRRNNGSAYDSSAKLLTWHVVWLTPCPQQSRIASMVSEKTILKDALKDLLLESCDSADERPQISGAVKQMIMSTDRTHDKMLAHRDATSQNSSAEDKKTAIDSNEQALSEANSPEVVCGKGDQSLKLATSEAEAENDSRASDTICEDAPCSKDVDPTAATANCREPEYQWKLYIKVEDRSRNKLQRYEELDVTKSLGYNLFQRSIVEHPVLHVCSAMHHSNAVARPR